MTNPVTPNIGLNKIDRTSPATTYFDLEKYIDQNADTVDRFAGEASQVLATLHQRLDTEARREVVLQPGLQIVNAERSAPFSLSGIKGRTLVNLLGRAGGCEDSSYIGSYISNYQSNIAIDGTRKPFGDNCLKVTSTVSGPNSSYAIFTAGYLQPGYYLFAAEVDTGSMKRASLNFESVLSDLFVTSGNFMFKFIRFYVSSPGDYSVNVLFEPTEIGQIGYVDNARLYPITATENSEIDNLTSMEVAEKFPCVDSIQPVRNPYAIRYGENLLRPFYEWNVATNGLAKIIAPYEANVEITSEGTASPLRLIVPVLPNTTYTVTSEGNAISGNGVQIIERKDSNDGDASGEINGGYFGNVPGKVAVGTVTFTTTEQTRFLSVRLRFDTAGLYTIKNPMLNIGTTSKQFKPREDSMLALRTDLYADPLTGENADEVFERDGQYFKLANWTYSPILDQFKGPYEISNTSSGDTGFKRVRIRYIDLGTPAQTGPSESLFVTKFDGTVLKSGVLSAGDVTQIGDDGGITFGTYLLITVSNTDSGWGGNYTPTADEIKAYFMGWKMYDAAGNASSVYNGSGGKAWVNLAKYKKGDNSDWVTTLPTVAASGYTPYQLVYQLATPTVEPILSEGVLTFSEGGNQVEVGTGMVLRESVKPAFNGVSNWFINRNDTGFTSSLLKKRVDRILAVFRDSRVDNNWKSASSATPYGKELRYTEDANYDPSASCSVTYLMLDKSPIQPISGTIATNEKGQINDLTAGVADALQRVGVVEQKKTEKGEPDTDWISPTLLNGSLQHSNTNSFNVVGYKRLSNGEVRLRGMITVPTAGVVVFTMLSGFRPRRTLIFPCSASGGVVEVRVYASGNVTIASTADWLSLESISFLAEQ